jgi:hypothetical protein
MEKASERVHDSPRLDAAAAAAAAAPGPGDADSAAPGAALGLAVLAAAHAFLQPPLYVSANGVTGRILGGEHRPDCAGRAAPAGSPALPQLRCVFVACCSAVGPEGAAASLHHEQ